MGNIFVNITMSLDGFIAGTDISREQPMGVGGMRLHKWLFEEKTDVDAQILAEVTEVSGAVIIGNHIYTTAIDEAWGGVSPFDAPTFILAHRAPDTIVDGFTVVTEGIECALQQAQAVAGNKDVWVMGGANVIQQYVKAGLIDEIQIHLVPVLLGQGIRLFENIGTTPIALQSTRVVASTGVTHLKYRVVK